jgi:hypothetical protein
MAINQRVLDFTQLLVTAEIPLTSPRTLVAIADFDGGQDAIKCIHKAKKQEDIARQKWLDENVESICKVHFVSYCHEHGLAQTRLLRLLADPALLAAQEQLATSMTGLHEKIKPLCVHHGLTAPQLLTLLIAPSFVALQKQLIESAAQQGEAAGFFHYLTQGVAGRMERMPMRTAELKDGCLDWVVGSLQDPTLSEGDLYESLIEDNDLEMYSPSSRPAQGDTILAANNIFATKQADKDGLVHAYMLAEDGSKIHQQSATFFNSFSYLLPGMRCYVALNCGEVATVPQAVIDLDENTAAEILENPHIFPYRFSDQPGA